MILISAPSVWLILLGVSPALAVFEEFSFAGDGGNSSAPRVCGNMAYQCPAPSMCSLDTLTFKWYCCEPGNSNGPCWTGDTTCGAGTNKPSGQQIACSNLDVDYCCLDSEDCTKNANLFNICWSKQENMIRYLNKTKLNETYTSLSSAQPGATVITIGNAELYAMTSNIPGASSSTPASASASPTASTSTAPSSSNNSGLSGGAIGGIVGGVVGGLALLGLVAFLFWRRRQSSNNKINSYASPADPYQKYGYQPGYQPPSQTHEAPPYSPPLGVAATAQVSDKYAHVGQPAVAEVPGYQNPVEMDANHQQQASRVD